MINDTPVEIETFDPKGKRILMISAHPDDADFGASGTLVKWLKEGAKAAIVICTNGDKGSSDPKLTSKELAKVRHDEQLAASKFLGLDNTWFLDYPDAHLEVTQELKEKLVRIIREYKPDAIMTFDPTMVYSVVRGTINHPDHRAVGQAALDAIFPMARDFLTFPGHGKEGLQPHKVIDIFLYNFDKANFFVDISQTIDTKLAVLATHKSQVNFPDTETWLREWNHRNGKKIGVEYAEGFVHIHLH